MTATPPECARLATELRGLRERSGLSLSALAGRSAYSRSTWQRYLAGSALPPWSAVRMLCGLADEPEPRLRALWELADCAWSRRTATHPAAVGQGPQAAVARSPEPTVARSPEPAVAPAEPAPLAEPPAENGPVPIPPPPPTDPAGPSCAASPRPRTRRRLVGVAAVSAFLGLACLLLSVTVGGWSGPRPPATLSVAASAGFQVGCRGIACDGRDPGVTLCGVEPKTLLHVQTPAGVGLEIRYNPQCQAVWARIWNAAPGDRLTLNAPGRPTQSVTVAHPADEDPFVYTPLTAVTPRGTNVGACVAASPGSTRTCWSVPSP